jgi:hypothetical protein
MPGPWSSTDPQKTRRRLAVSADGYKQRDARDGRFQGTKPRVIFGVKAEVVALLGKSMAYIERGHLTSRYFGHLGR